MMHFERNSKMSRTMLKCNFENEDWGPHVQDQTTGSTVYPVWTACRCNHGYRCICPSSAFPARADATTSLSFMAFFLLYITSFFSCLALIFFFLCWTQPTPQEYITKVCTKIKWKRLHLTFKYVLFEFRSKYKTLRSTYMLNGINRAKISLF